MLHWTINLKQTPNGGYPLAAVAVLNKLYSFGGKVVKRKKKGTKACLSVHVFNTVSLRWTKPATLPAAGKGKRPPEVPSLRYGHTAVLIEDMVYIWGGCKYAGGRLYDTQKYSSVLYAFDVDAHVWSRPEVSGAAPEARLGHSACALERVMLVCGGLQLTGHTNDVYKLDTATMSWCFVYTRGTPGPVSSDHSATVIGTKMFVFGGRGDKAHFNDIRVFETETNCWLRTPSAQRLPEGRRGHSAFTYNGELYIFGGCDWDRTTDFNDLWKFNPDGFSWEKVEAKGKAPRPMYNMCCCTVGERVVLFGGYNAPERDLCVLDLSPSLKTLCKLAVVQDGMEQAELPHDIRWELVSMTTNGKSHTHVPNALPKS